MGLYLLFINYLFYFSLLCEQKMCVTYKGIIENHSFICTVTEEIVVPITLLEPFLDTSTCVGLIGLQ